MAIEDAIARVNQFKGESLAETIATLESELARTDSVEIAVSIRSLGISRELLLAAMAVKQASAQINVVIHAVGILYALPHILREDEVVEALSLGASSVSSDFDLVTDQRIAEFKFIHWQPKGNAVRNKTLFQDFFKLAREQTAKEKYLYLLSTEIPLRFLRGDRNVMKVLDRNRRLADDFRDRYGQTYRTVGEFYEAHRAKVHVVNLVETMPGFKQFLEDLTG